MRFSPGRRIELDDGTSADVLTRGEAFLPGLLAWDANVGGAHVLAVSEDPSASESVRARAASSLRAIGPRRGARLGAERRARIRSNTEPTVGYRDSALPGANDDGLVAFFSVTPTLPFARALAPTTREPWPFDVVARLAVDVARAMTETTYERLDPSSVGLSERGVWLLDPGLDALLRPEFRAHGGLRGSTSWMGYLAPESVRRRARDDGAPPNDVSARHGLGVLLHELLTGEPLYGGQTPLETLVALRRGLPTLLSQTVPGIPLDLAACVHALLDHDPLRRPDPLVLAQTLEPHAARDLSWTRTLLDAHAKPLGFLPFTLRRAT